MSNPAVVVPFRALHVVAPGWAAWANRLDVLLATSCQGLAARGRRTRRVTITLTYADGRRRRRSMMLPRATHEARDILPAALGLLRLLVAERPGVASKLSLHLGQLSTRTGRPVALPTPVRFVRRRPAPASGPRVRHAWLRALAAVALLVGMPHLLPLG